MEGVLPSRQRIRPRDAVLDMQIGSHAIHHNSPRTRRLLQLFDSSICQRHCCHVVADFGLRVHSNHGAPLNWNQFEHASNIEWGLHRKAAVNPIRNVFATRLQLVGGLGEPCTVLRASA